MSDVPFDVILADPSWAYRNLRTGGSHKSGSAQRYPTMALEEIVALPVGALAATDAVLFLWAPPPLGADPYRVVEAWGFTFKTEWYWHKVGRKGTGYWTRGCVEKLLIGVRGKVKAWRSNLDNWIEGGWTDDEDAFDGVFESKPEGHSRKPAVVRQMIEYLTPDVEVCLGCGRPTKDRDCGCPAGTGMRPTRRVELFSTQPEVPGWDHFGLAIDPSHDFRDPAFWARFSGPSLGLQLAQGLLQYDPDEFVDRGGDTVVRRDES